MNNERRIAASRIAILTMGLLGAVPLALAAAANAYSFFAGRSLSLTALVPGIVIFGYLYLIPRSVSVIVATECLDYRGFDGLRWRQGSIPADSVVDFDTVHPYSASLQPAAVQVIREGAASTHRIPLGSLDPHDCDLILEWLGAAQQRRQQRLEASAVTN